MIHTLVWSNLVAGILALVVAMTSLALALTALKRKA